MNLESLGEVNELVDVLLDGEVEVVRHVVGGLGNLQVHKMQVVLLHPKTTSLDQKTPAKKGVIRHQVSFKETLQLRDNGISIRKTFSPNRLFFDAETSPQLTSSLSLSPNFP